MHDMTDIELLTWMELRFGLTKSVSNTSPEQIEAAEAELTGILNKYKTELNIENPIPRIKMWIAGGKINFMFFDRKTGKRVLLGHWLSSKGEYYEH